MNIKSRIIFKDAKMISFFAVLSLSMFITLNIPQKSFATHEAGHVLGFAAAGDWGCNSNTDATATSIFNKGNAVDLVFGLGDYSYQSTATCFINEMKESGNNIFPKMDGTTLTGGTGTMAIGNHEDDSDEARSAYSSNFNFPNSGYYSFDTPTDPKIHFLVMTTEDSFSTSSSQYNFVVNDLSSASSNPDIRWIVVVFHKPLYSSPNECGSSTCAGYPSFRAIYHPIFDQRGVDLVLVGHTHDYQRTYPITYGGSSSSNPQVTSNNANTYSDPAGIIHAIVGTGGVNFHDLNSKSSFVSYQQDSRFGYLNVDITKSGDTHTLTGKFFGNGLATPMDTFTINKGPPPPPPETYSFAPSFVVDGNDKVEIPSSSSLQASSSFTIASWFKTTSNFASDAYIVSKGGYDPSEASGQNQNYALLMDSNEKIKFRFETTSGTDVSVTSPLSYNDGKWHYATGVFDDSNNSVRLYIDGVQVTSTSTSNSPDGTGTQPFTAGANSGQNSNFFIGEIDEVRLWNGKVLSASQISTAYNNGQYPIGETIRLAFNSVTANNYKYNPFGTFSGSNYISVSSSSSLQAPSSFTVEGWFKTNTNFAGDAFIVTKGGIGSDSSGKNMNYGIWMDSSERIRGGFETSSGSDRYLTSPLSYSDNNWHHAALVFNDPANQLILYVDGVQVASLSTSSVPESSGTQPFRIATNSYTLNKYFTGNLDEIRVWKGAALSAQQVSEAFNNGIHASGTSVVSQHSFDLPSGLSVSAFNKIPSFSFLKDREQNQVEKTDTNISMWTNNIDNGIPIIIPFK